ncbi:hydrogenase [Xinfangfangia sp. D13-10-4-6]|uniref:3-hydroxyacyl-CoA dehydrogenase family protein n=1 Tax=Pseudogemmobacter hezensis TaxID=2737662 RepID=UPI0015549996|nr:3-hydroxyacyl-CoA dehydrogenase NAD-binding domain-containing protein [Pseudogemmobacter hezensis]NPD16974.1 hydrogenase [Pseudogemmobacter hezensis]
MANVWILGGGLIGAGWAAAFVQAGHQVLVIDPDTDATKARIDATLERVGAAVGLPDGWTPPQILAAPAGPAPDLLQECLPERLALKQAALQAVLPHLGADTLIASSSSGLSPDDLAAGLEDPGRVFIAHPCNPPWLMPVVELSGGAQTSPATLTRARAFYEAMGKQVLTLNKPMPGHLVNRLQAALWREAVHLAREGVASLGDIEAAVTKGLAPRWCIMGPSAVFHVSGGPRGFEGFFDALAPEFERWWDSLGQPRFDAQTRSALVEGMAAADPRSVAEIGADRDRRLPEILDFLRHQASGDTDKA